ncbi:MAG: hypothetical protein AAF697_10150 [Pseudomonadota bacterium]
MSWTQLTPRSQEALRQEPYDRWIAIGGVCMAEFYRETGGYLIRFPGQADFKLSPDDGGYTVAAWPVPGCDDQSLDNLYHNAIQPILGNHAGGLFLHGSAVMIDAPHGDSNKAGAIAFLGLSRAGKTTLAGSFARAGFPFLTEDVIDLQRREGEYWVQPKRSKLRLFADSAHHLIGDETQFADLNTKQDVDGGEAFPFVQSEVPLRHIYVLGTDHAAPLAIRQLAMAQALRTLMPHAFILDVDDRSRLKEHFGRMADLAQNIPCFSLDFTRDYAELRSVRAALLESFASSQRP